MCKGYAKDTQCALPSVPSVPSGDLRILGSTAAGQGFASVEEFSSLKGRIWQDVPTFWSIWSCPTNCLSVFELFGALCQSQ